MIQEIQAGMVPMLRKKPEKKKTGMRIIICICCACYASVKMQPIKSPILCIVMQCNHISPK